MKNLNPAHYLSKWSETNSLVKNQGKAFITTDKLETMDLDAAKEKIRSFLQKIVPSFQLKDSDDIFSLGLVNSMFAMELVLFVEKTFKIKVENSDLHLDNFKSINAIDVFIH